MKDKQIQVQVKVTDEVLKGVYANMLQVGHTQEEFVLDFMNILPPQGIISSRIIISPTHMKRMIAALQDNIDRYEEHFGNIPNISPNQATSSFSVVNN